MSGFKAKSEKKSIFAKTPRRELTALPRPPKCIKGGLLLRGVRERGERKRRGRDQAAKIFCPRTGRCW